MNQHVKIVPEDARGSELLLPTDLAGRAVLRRRLSKSGHDGELVGLYCLWPNGPMGLRDLIVFRLGEFDERAPGMFSADQEYLDVCFCGERGDTYTLEVVPSDIRYQDFCTSLGECSWRAVLGTRSVDRFLFRDFEERKLLGRLGEKYRRVMFLDELVDGFARIVGAPPPDEVPWFRSWWQAREVDRLSWKE